jgi:hypothetical protein
MNGLRSRCAWWTAERTLVAQNLRRSAQRSTQPGRSASWTHHTPVSVLAARARLGVRNMCRTNESARDSRLWRLNTGNSQVPWTMHLPVRPASEAASCLASCIQRPCRRWIFEFPRISHPSVASVSEALGLPGSPLLKCRLPMSLRVAPNPAPSGFAEG